MRSSKYRIVDLGRPAVFLIPKKKLKKRINGRKVSKVLHKFLVKNFTSFTKITIPHFGAWVNEEKVLILDKCRMYEVSFLGKERVPLLMEKLAWLAEHIGEDCIYFKAGQYTSLIYPSRPRTKR